MHVFGRYALSMLLFFFFNSQIALILNRLYGTSRVLMGKESRKPCRLQFVKEGMERSTYNSLGNWEKRVPGLFM